MRAESPALNPSSSAQYAGRLRVGSTLVFSLPDDGSVLHNATTLSDILLLVHALRMHVHAALRFTVPGYFTMPDFRDLHSRRPLPMLIGGAP